MMIKDIGLNTALRCNSNRTRILEKPLPPFPCYACMHRTAVWASKSDDVPINWMHEPAKEKSAVGAQSESNPKPSCMPTRQSSIQSSGPSTYFAVQSGSAVLQKYPCSSTDIASCIFLRASKGTCSGMIGTSAISPSEGVSGHASAHAMTDRSDRITATLCRQPTQTLNHCWQADIQCNV